jgi:hypothetical protein
MRTELQNTAPLPPALRALALGLLIETGATLLGGTRDEPPAPPGSVAVGAEGEGPLWQALRSKCGELSALVLRADDPGEAAAYVLDYLPQHLEHVFEQLFGRKGRTVPNRPGVWGRGARGDGERDAGPA